LHLAITTHARQEEPLENEALIPGRPARLSESEKRSKQLDKFHKAGGSYSLRLFSLAVVFTAACTMLVTATRGNYRSQAAGQADEPSATAMMGLSQQTRLMANDADDMGDDDVAGDPVIGATDDGLPITSKDAVEVTALNESSGQPIMEWEVNETRVLNKAVKAYEASESEFERNNEGQHSLAHIEATRETYAKRQTHKGNPVGPYEAHAAEGDEEMIEAEIDLRAYAPVRKYLEERGVTSENLFEYVPRKITVKYHPSRVAAELGDDAGKGALVLNLVHRNDSNGEGSYASSYLIVLNYSGAVLQVRPSGGKWSGVGMAMGQRLEYSSTPVRFDALRMRDSQYVLLAASVNASADTGPAFMYDWRADRMLQLGAGDWGAKGSAADIGWVSKNAVLSETGGSGNRHSFDETHHRALSGEVPLEFVRAVNRTIESIETAAAILASPDDDESTDPRTGGAFWRTSSAGFDKYDAVTGALLSRVSQDPSVVSGVNHVQVLADGSSVLSGRATNSFVKVDGSGATQWVCGGPASTLEIIDRDGTVYPPGSGDQPWYGQNQVEYHGNGEYMLFDNSFEVASAEYMSSSARLLIVKIDEVAATAAVEWEYEVGHQTAMFGDNDQLPSGNLFTTDAPRMYDIDKAHTQYDTRVYEVTRNKEVAFELLVSGAECKLTKCEDRSPKGNTPSGWSMTSVERFYFTPIVNGVHCSSRCVHVRAGGGRTRGSRVSHGRSGVPRSFV